MVRRFTNIMVYGGLALMAYGAILAAVTNDSSTLGLTAMGTIALLLGYFVGGVPK
jgi:hypothetical protein